MTRYTIAVSSLEPEQRFWLLMEENLQRVEAWYNECVERHLAKFHELVHRTIQFGLLTQYIPIERSLTTQLDREIERFGLSSIVPWKNDRLPAHHSPAARCLVAMNRGSDLNETIGRSIQGYQASRSAIQNSQAGEFDSEDDVPLAELLTNSDMIALKNKLAEEEAPEQPRPNWEEEDDEYDYESNYGARWHSRDHSTIGINRLGVGSSTVASSSDGTGSKYEKLGSQLSSGLNTTQHSRHSSNFGQDMMPSSSYGALPSQHSLLSTKPDNRKMPASALPPHLRAAASKNRVDNFFDDLDDDREEDLITPMRLDEFAGNPGSPIPRDHHAPVSRSYMRNNEMHMMASPSGQLSASTMSSHTRSDFGNPGTPTGGNLASGVSNPALGGVGSPLGPGTPTLAYGPQNFGAGGPAGLSDLSDPRVFELHTTQLKREWSELYRDLHLLKQFALLNMEAISKILNKHDKNISAGAKHRFLQLNGARCAFLRREHLKLVIRETEHVYAQAFTGGHRTAAMNALRVSSEAPEVGMATFRFGFFLGISIVMALIIAFICVITDSSYLVRLRPGLIVFRMLTLGTFLMWSWGLTMVVCNRHRINFTRIFEFTERPLYQQVFEVTAFLTLVLTIAALIYVAGGIQQFQTAFEIPLLSFLSAIPLAVLPLCVTLLFLLTLLYLQIRQGWWSALSFGRVLCAPFFPVTYQDFHTAEMLLSSCILLFDFQFSLCYFIMDSFRTTDSCQYQHQYVNALIAILPSAWRTLQCLRRWADLQEPAHLMNAGKNALGILVTLLALLSRLFGSLGNFWIALWLIAVFVLTVVTSYWDIIQDWSLGERQVKYPGLRSTVLLSARWYYFAMIVTPLGRLLFALTLSPDIISYRLNADVFIMLLATIEMARKTMWSILRLENEQLQNADILHNAGFEVEQAYPDFFGEDILATEFV